MVHDLASNIFIFVSYAKNIYEFKKKEKEKKEVPLEKKVNFKKMQVYVKPSIFQYLQLLHL